ncbi:HGE-14 family type IV secretion system effector [Anaplasma phagocytophilum]|uniref:HGE-14 family type IV secretion system effector n=1 Tax=Anaplasma phagocytophilum TaxID=948 RepID=UPI00201A330F
MVNEVHTPSIFTSKSDSGYCYSGTASAVYRDAICAEIETGSISRDDFWKVLQGCVGELREIFDCVFRVDPEVADLVARTAYIRSLVDIARVESSVLDEGLVGKLRNIVEHLYDTLHVCAALTCNKDKFRNPDYTERRTYLQMAQACSIVVNSIAMLNCCAQVADPQAHASDVECDQEVVSSIKLSLNTYLNTKCAALLGCLKPAMRAVRRERKKTALRAVRHCAEIARKVADLVDIRTPRCFRHRTENCLNMILDAVESDATECVAMLCRDEKSLLRLSLATEARIALCRNLDQYVGKSEEEVSTAQSCTSVCINALIRAMGCLLLVYREYAASGIEEHPFACSIERCIQILRDSVYPKVSQHEWGEEGGSNLAHRVRLCICQVTDELQAVTPELLLSPHISGELHRKALCSLEEMSSAWKSANSEHFHVPEEQESPSSQPSTSGLGGTGAGLGDQPASSHPNIPLCVLESVSPLSSRPSTSVCTSSVLEEACVSSYRSRTPSGDLEPPIKRARSA